MPPVVRPYRGVAADERRRERREKLLDACLDAVAESGVSTVTVDDICARAGLSKRYFYESFGDRDAILVSALDDVIDTVGTALNELEQEHGSTEERVAHTAAALVRALTADPRSSLLYTEASANPALEDRRRQMVDRFTPLLMKAVLDADPADPRAEAATVLMIAGTTELLDRWLRGTLTFTEAEFVDTLTALGVALATSF
ncbi:TetR/AcrR family transcriptional regulator [Rhodococcus sp. 05-340-1]|jgi:AcrR family transcriptional regulator|uniref:TetR/AcrR family transcriptional regulator n=1 Tax=Nocardiaceae TaxID=85025 RepID=UPI000568528D|nr:MULTISPECIES: TetR/AcrR family transcriptional regulator [Rhodococcus]OZD71174.1 TetR/AcrR family transcriptional regulator [Rhodococcus sp. 05-340-2]OZD74019.1 TetR/AcrR family transcriptional regulator [Rhodococcus sp. 05-340-1]OZE99717.1 TetR/AcrR family transcriptional regulator [Rhodococcus sp. 15-2388-1-1a]OZF37026.1 TetR/AcrR family transcriptional regulator [Rhodococcus sp. 14-2483-1-2]